MISFKEVGNAGKASEYYSSTARAAEYYQGETIPSQWSGHGAEIQGLSGPVEHEAFKAQLEGRVKDSTGDRELGRINADGEIEHRSGWDFTISAPKSVSTEALVHGREDVIEAHRAAVRESMEYLERYGAQTRVGGEFVATGNLTTAEFEHVTSRAGDPQLHTHAIVSNVTLYEGRAYSVSNERLLEHRKAADAIYHQALGRELERMGYRVEYDSAGHAEIGDYSREDLREFSTRSREIEEALAARGQTRETSSAEARQAAALETRAEKNFVESREANAERWQAQASALGIKPAARVGTIEHALTARDEVAAAREAVRQAVAHLTEREFVFKETDLHCEAVRFSHGRTTWHEIEHEIERAEQAHELIRDTSGDRFTTAEAREAERVMAEKLEAGKAAHEAIMSKSEFQEALDKFETRKAFESGNDFHLNPEQRAAAEAILTGNDRFQGVQGLAGTGKTTTLEFVRESAESKGWEVTGHSNGSEQAQKMQAESGIKSTTTAAHLLKAERTTGERGSETGASKRELRIMDEASQAGQKDFNRVIATTEASGAKTVFLGDRHQHQSVESGRAFERAQAHMPTSQLGRESITRQQTEQTKAVVGDVLDKRYAEAIRRMDVREVRPNQDRLAAEKPDASREERRAAARADNREVVTQIAKDYAAQPVGDRDRTLILTSTNADRRAINDAVRDELKQRGELGQGTQASTLTKHDHTQVESKRAASYKPGDVIEAQRGSRRHSTQKGERFTVERVDSRTNTLRVRDAQGRERTIDPGKTAVKGYERESREFAVGDKVKFTENHQLTDTRGESHYVRNGQRAEVSRVDADRGTVTFKSAGRDIEIPARDLKADHSYASTSHSAQGQTVDRAWLHHNTEAGRHGDRETYVNATRARFEARIYSQDLEKASKQAGVEMNKTAACDVTPARDMQHDTQRQAEPQRTQADRGAQQQRPQGEAVRDAGERQPQRGGASQQYAPHDLRNGATSTPTTGRGGLTRGGHAADSPHKDRGPSRSGSPERGSGASGGGTSRGGGIQQS